MRLCRLTNRQLKDAIVERGVNHKHCIEKHDLQKLTQRVQQVLSLTSGLQLDTSLLTLLYPARLDS